MANELTKVRPIDEVRKSLALMKDQFALALPPQIEPDKFIRVTMTALQQTPALVTANRQSLYAACMKAAQDGLLPDGREAALVMFGQDVAYLPMVGGILKKVRNSGELASITSQMVHKNDRFRFWIDGEGEHIDHEPLMFGERGEAIGVYALAKTKDGALYVEVMDKAQVMAVKGASKAKSGPWQGVFEHEMWRKTAIRRLSKRLPMNTDLETVIKRDDEMYDLEKPNGEVQMEIETKPKKLKKIIQDQAPVDVTPEPQPEPQPEEI